jgi:multidrug efflux pump
VTSFIGVDGTNPTPNTGRLSLSLVPRERRQASAGEISARLQERLKTLEGLQVHLQSVQDFSIDNRVSSTQYQFTIEDADPVELASWGPKLLAKLRTLPELQDVASDQQSGGLQLALKIDRDTASRLGVSLQAIDDTL